MDFKNELLFAQKFEIFEYLRTKINEFELFTNLVGQLKTCKTYTERCLNSEELKDAFIYGITMEDLVDEKTEPAIKRLDEISVRFREIGNKITQENYKTFIVEIESLCAEGITLIDFGSIE